MSSNLGAVLLTSNSLYFMRWYDLGKVLTASSVKEMSLSFEQETFNGVRPFLCRFVCH